MDKKYEKVEDFLNIYKKTSLAIRKVNKTNFLKKILSINVFNFRGFIWIYINV